MVKTSLFVLDLELVGAQRVVNAPDMLGAGGFKNQFDFGFANCHLAETAAVSNL